MNTFTSAIPAMINSSARPISHWVWTAEEARGLVPGICKDFIELLDLQYSSQRPIGFHPNAFAFADPDEGRLRMLFSDFYFPAAE